MAFNHRKLFSDSSSAEISSLVCSPFCCDPSKNRDVICPESCITWCRSNGYVQLTPAPPDPLAPTTTLSHHPSKPSKFHLFLIISLPILATVFLLFCCYKIYKYYKNWRSRRRRRRRRSSQPQQEQDQTHDDFLDQDHGPELDHPIWYIRTVGLNPSTINSIAVCKYKRGDGLVEGTECSVCLNEFQEDETLRLLPKCNHAFHITCIDNWLSSHTNCPLCRASIAANPARLPTPSPEQSVDNSIVWEETQVVISEGSGDFRIETEEEGELQVENGKKSPETSKEEVVDEVQRMRRSVSVDSLSASVISAATANAHLRESDGNSGAQLVKVNESNMEIVPKKVDVNLSLMRSVGDSSTGRSLQKGPVLMKRSVSCTGKVLLNPGSPVVKGHT